MSWETLRDGHAEIIASMTDDQRLAMAREILASAIQMKAKLDIKKPRYISRMEALEGVFVAEKTARDAGAVPKVDFFLPIDADIPLQAL